MPEELPGAVPGDVPPVPGTVLAGGTELAGAERLGGAAPPGTVGTDEAGVSRPSMRLPLPPGRSLAKKASAKVLTKKTAAMAAVSRDRKLADPVAPKRLPDAPEPKAAPMSAPLPC